MCWTKLFYFLYFLCRIYFFCVLNTITRPHNCPLRSAPAFLSPAAHWTRGWLVLLALWTFWNSFFIARVLLVRFGLGSSSNIMSKEARNKKGYNTNRNSRRQIFVEGFFGVAEIHLQGDCFFSFVLLYFFSSLVCIFITCVCHFCFCWYNYNEYWLRIEMKWWFN